MDKEFKKYINTFTDNLLYSLKKDCTDCKSIYIIKHYNTFRITNEDITRTGISPHLYFRDFSGSSMHDAYEPFLGIIKDFYTKYYSNDKHSDNIELFLDECGVYPLHRSIFKSFIETGICLRDEDILLGEVAYEHNLFLLDVKLILTKITSEHTILLYINNLNIAPKSTIELLDMLYSSNRLKNLLIFATYNELHPVTSFTMEIWERFVERMSADDCIIDCVFTEQIKNGSLSSFRFYSDNIPEYLIKLTNLFNCLDFDQFHYYMRIIYQKLEMENLSIDSGYRFRLVRLFATYSIYANDMSNALLLCESLRHMKEKYNTYETIYSYHYLSCLTYMYNGKHSHAHSHYEKCLSVATKHNNSFDIFKARLLDVMVKMSGWRNLFFCNNDVNIDEDFLLLAKKYNYINHLAHIYIFAFENSREIYAGNLDTLNERLSNFNKGIQLALEINNKMLLTDAYRKNIMISSSCGAFETSDYFYSKLHHIVGSQNPITEADIYKGWGYNCCATEQYQYAHDYFKKALLIYYNLGMAEQIPEVLYNMSINCLLSDDYEQAYAYLQTALKTVNALHLNDLRVCNISKLFGLLSLCCYRLNNIYNCQLYLDSTKQFLTHILGKNRHDKVFTGSADPSYTACDDDLFLYYYVNALLAMDTGCYEKSLDYFNNAYIYVKRSEGNLFFSFVQYKLSLARLYRLMGSEKERITHLEEALAFCQKKNNTISTQKVLCAMSSHPFKCTRYNFTLDNISLDDINKLTKETSIKKNYDATKKQLDFLSNWQKITDITDKSRSFLIETAMNTISTNFSLDAEIYIKYHDSVPHVEFNNSYVTLDEKALNVLTEYFDTHRIEFVTSKIRKNYNEYETVLSVLDSNNICSIVCIPFFVNEKIDSLFINIIFMKNNWNSVINKYMLDESDLSIFSLAYRQLVNALDLLDKQNHIGEINTQLKNAAITDYLTGLYNRDGFYSKVEHLIENTSKSGSPLGISVLYIDLDNFKYYNDTFGHDIGDLILKKIASLLTEVTDDSGFAVRFGGDEFLIVLGEASEEKGCLVAETFLNKIKSYKGYEEEISNFLKRKISIPAQKCVSASIGISIAPEVKSMEDISTTLKNADSTLYQIKHTTKNNFLLS